MKRTIGLLLLLFCAARVAQAEDAVNWLSLPTSMTFDSVAYRLSWSSHPVPAYYLQEYLPAGETSEHYLRMVLVCAIVERADVNSVVASKIAWLNRRKATDPIVNFAVVRNPANGEVILDFVLSAGPVVEWNAYRYSSLKKDGNLLFGISRRAYGDDATEFLRGLKAVRSAGINALAAYALPAVQPTK